MISLDKLQDLCDRAPDRGPPVEALRPVETALDDIPALALTEAEAHRLRHGQTVALLTRQDRERLMAVQGADGGDGTVIALFGGTPVALARVEGAEVRPVRVLNLT